MKNLDMNKIYPKDELSIHGIPSFRSNQAIPNKDTFGPSKDKNIEPVYFPPFIVADQEKIEGESYESITEKMKWWFTDQAILSSAGDEENINLENSNCYPVFEKGVWRLFANNKCVEFVNDRKRLNLNYLSEFEIEKNGITIYATQYIDEYFCISSEFFFHQQTMRFSTILGVYITCVEISKAIFSPPSISGAFIANAVGVICLLWLYGWGYYVFRGTLNGKDLFPTKEHRKKAKEDILKYLSNLVKFQLSTPSKEFTNELSHALDAAKLFGINKDESTIEEALHLLHTIKPLILSTSSEENFLLDKESLKEANKATKKSFASHFCWQYVKCLDYLFGSYFNKCKQMKEKSDTFHKNVGFEFGFFQLLDVANKYILDGPGKISEKKIVTVWLVSTMTAAIIGAFVGGIISSWSTYLSCHTNNHDLPDYCGYGIDIGMYLSLGYSLIFINLALLMCGVISVFAGIINAAITCHTLISSWFRRYSSVRKIRLQDWKRASSHHQNDFISEAFIHLKHDAYERYLFICEIMEKMSDVWSSLLTAILIVAGMLVIYYYTMILIYPLSLTYISAEVLCLIIWAMPVAALAYSNSAMSKLEKSLINSAPMDFDLIGGRADWVDYVKQTPALWCIFGFAITPGFLATVIGAASSAAMGAIIVSLLE